MGRIEELISDWPIEKRVDRVKTIYAERMNRELNLENPILFTEIQQWIKLYCNNPDISKCVDKVSFKDYIAGVLGDGFTAKTYGVWTCVDDVSMESIPDKCVVKSNCMGSSKFNYVIKDKSELDLVSIENEIKNDWFDPLKLNINSFAAFYYGIKPQVIVEENLINEGDYFYEWKVLCFHGVPKCIYFPERTIENGNVNQNGLHSFYTADWKYMDIRYSKYGSRDNVKRPDHLDEILSIAKKLSKPFPYVRVDFYERSDSIYVGELTFTQGGGLKPLYPENTDSIFGQWIIEKTWKDKYLVR